MTVVMAPFVEQVMEISVCIVQMYLVAAPIQHRMELI